MRAGGLTCKAGALGARRSGDMQALNESLENALAGERSLLRIEDVAAAAPWKCWPRAWICIMAHSRARP